MIVVRFRVTCQPDRTDDVRRVLEDVVAPSRQVDGVVSFDIGRDVSDPDVFIATEVFDDRAALDRQESLAEVASAMSVLEKSLVGPPEATVYHVSRAEPYGD
ncbi:antibiotic biosynthesis monooxygenase [Geodermatophilus sp. YIM 151500]|uniref:putative quinol monooxygenase n=1 Tax=Geodermatophilus sp. YIM 151500 TaxID=2984531 RepID=UPI0021E46C45|nr:putative quinol monooxygenase [Geodermatophilus sp. YIM 151500]MCV2489415.1 antibiotic biosynthesis monooxygenase [Geodermatophilus sp. YIM 151500]